MKTVLIVDDNIKNLDLFKDFVESWGYETVTAQQGKDAISLAERYLPDIILLDVMLPGMSGYEVCRELKENTKTQHIPVVMITVLNDIADRIHGYKIGADQFLVKPVDYNELHAILDSLFGKKSMFDEMESRGTVIESLNVLLKQCLPSEAVLLLTANFIIAVSCVTISIYLKMKLSRDCCWYGYRISSLLYVNRRGLSPRMK